MWNTTGYDVADQKISLRLSPHVRRDEIKHKSLIILSSAFYTRRGRVAISHKHDEC